MNSTKKRNRSTYESGDGQEDRKRKSTGGGVEDGGEAVELPEVNAEALEAVEATFESLGLHDSLVMAARAMGWKNPTHIQAESLPPALQGRDIVGLAKTGSGKTGAFALAVLQRLLDAPQGLFCVVLSPTRELAFQIAQQFKVLGAPIGLTVAPIVGGVESVKQAMQLAKKPHVVVATPGRLAFHLKNTKGFSLRASRCLVLDEADRLLSDDYVSEVNYILAELPHDRQTFLFSATMTSKVVKLERTSLRDPVKVHVASKYATVDTLVQHMVFLPFKHKEVYLVSILNDFQGNSIIVFVDQCHRCQLLALMLESLGYPVTALHGKMKQEKRKSALTQFASGEKRILMATDIAARGLDIPSVDLVINYDVPDRSKAYVHRVGRTARSNRSGRAITMVTQYDIELFQKIEHSLGQKLEVYPTVREEVLILEQRVAEAHRVAVAILKDSPNLVVDFKATNDRKAKPVRSKTPTNDMDRARSYLSSSDRSSQSSSKQSKFSKSKRH